MTENPKVISLILDDLNHIKETFDFYCSFDGPSSIRQSETVYHECLKLVHRGIKVRCLIEITKDNASNCKWASNFLDIRHIEGLKGFTGIADSKFFFNYTSESRTGEVEQLKNTSKEFVQLQQYLYDILWSKAIPVSIRLKQIEEGAEPEVTEIVTGWAGIIHRTIEGFSKAIEAVDHCCDAMIPPMMVESPVNKAILDFFNRGGKTRMITEITKENLASVKELVKTQEIRHMNAFKLNFGVSDRMFSAPTSVYSMSAEPQCIWSNSKDLIRQHQYLFDTLWSKAIPAKQRFKEIEQGAKTEFVETVRDAQEIEQLSLNLVKMAEEEIAILFSMTNASQLQAKTGTLKLLQEAALSRAVKVRILVPVSDDDGGTEIISDAIICQLKESGIDIRQIKKEGRLCLPENKLTLLVVDQSVCLTIELENDSEQPLGEAIRLATYTNSGPTVFAYSSIFENIWIQAEIMMRTYTYQKSKDD